MWQVKHICLSCKHYRLTDAMSGVCRVDRSDPRNYPLKLNEDSCESWSDSGQQYFIRKGWIKGRKEREDETEAN